MLNEVFVCARPAEIVRDMHEAKCSLIIVCTCFCSVHLFITLLANICS